jgi:histidyl-tRNA synthetase
VDRKQRFADRLGARVLVLIGPDEQADGSATVRDMRNRQQHRAPLARLAAAVAEALAQEQPST